MEKEKVNFKTNILLKNIIGKELINDDNIAVLELVKNSYDAGAQKVEIYFKNVKGNLEASEIIILDDGVGMSREDITEKWLNIAYSDKKSSPYKKDQKTGRRRYQAGNKGIGRFSCDRLGAKLDLYTQKEGGELVVLSINWKEFEKEDLPKMQIQSVQFDLEDITTKEFFVRTGLQSLNKGTTLHIKKLLSVWDADKILSLRRDLERLINPNQAFEKDDFFEISIFAKEFEDDDRKNIRSRKVSEVINGKIENRVFSRLKFKTTYIELDIDELGQKITTALFHNGQRVYQLVEKNFAFENLKRVKVVIYFLNQYKKMFFRRETSISSVDFGSIFLFINGFRVPPYGDRGNDWLGMDNRKNQGQARYLATRDILGRIEITDLKGKFEVVSSREGIVRNPMFTELVSSEGFYYMAHKRLEKFVVDGLNWDQLKDKKIRPSQLEKIENENQEVYEYSEQYKRKAIIDNFARILSVKPSSIISLDINEELIEEIKEQQDQKTKQLLETLQKYDTSGILSDITSKNLQTLGLVLEKKEKENKELKEENVKIAEENKQLREVQAELQSSVEIKDQAISHMQIMNEAKESELQFFRSTLSMNKKRLENFLHGIKNSSATIGNCIRQLIEEIADTNPKNSDNLLSIASTINEVNQQIHAVASYATKAGFNSRVKTVEDDICVFVQQYLKVVRGSRRIKTYVSASNEHSYKLKFKPVEVVIIVDNLLSNSENAEAKNAWLHFTKVSDQEIEMTFTDDGKGLDKSVPSPDYIFRRGFTTTSGSGLGLDHVRKIIEKMAGKVSVLKTEKGLGFIFKFTL